jgi:hypothetical protein
MACLRLSSERCATCEDLRRLKVRIANAYRSARNLYRAALNATDSAPLQNIEDELKQISAAHGLVCCAVNTHLTNQHSQTRSDPRNGPRKGVMI